MRKLQTVNVAVRQLTVKDGSRVTSTDEEAAQVLCDYFQQVFTREENEQKFNSSTTTSNAEQPPVAFEPEIVLEKLTHLKPDKSPGPDGMHPLYFLTAVRKSSPNH